MKKILSFMLVLSMLFSMVSFAIPAAEFVESAAEVVDVVETAPVSDDTAALSSAEDGFITVFEEDFQDHTETQTVVEIGTTAQVKPYWASNIQGYTNRPHIWTSGGTGPQNTSTSGNNAAGNMAVNSNLVLVTDDSGNNYYQIKSVDSKYWYLYVNFGPYNALSVAGDYILSFDVIQSRNANFSSISFSTGGSAPDNVNGVTASLTRTKATVPYIHRATVKFTLDDTNTSRRTFQIQGTMGGTTTLPYGFDNFKLEYRAPIVESTVTFDANGVEATVPTAIDTQVGATVDLTDVVATTDDETKLFKGWATSADSTETITSLEITETAHTLYAVWETVQVGVTYPPSGVVFFEDFEDHTEAQTVLTVGSNAEIKPYWATNIQDTTSGVVMYGPSGSTSNSNMTLEIDAATGNKYYGINYDSKYWYLYFNFGPDNAIAAPGDYVLSFDVIQSRNSGFSSIGFGNTAYPKPADTKVPATGSLSAVQNKTAPYVHRASVKFTLTGDSWNGAWESYDFRRTFQIQGTMGGTGFYGIDNVKLEYVAPITVVPATVTFDANGVAATVPDAISTTTGTEIDLTTYTATTTDETKKFVGWATTADGEVITSLEVSEVAHTLYAIWEEVVVLTDCTIVDVDFEKVAVGTVLLNNNAANTNITWRATDNKAVANYRIVRGNSESGHGFSGRWLGGNAVVAEVNGNKVMKVVTSVGVNGGYSQFSIRTPGMATEGTYTVSFKYMIPTESTVDRIMFFPGDYTDNSGSPTVTNFVNQQIQKGVWYTYYDTVKVGSGGHAVLESIKFRTKTATADSYIYIDDINYYYETPKTPSVVTFATTNPAVSVPAAANSGIGGRVDLSLYVPTIKDSTLGFKGWSTTQNESGLITDRYFVPTTAAHTLYAITEQTSLVHPYFSTEFGANDKVIFDDVFGAEVDGVDEYNMTHTVVDGVLRTTFTDLNFEKNGTWIADPIQTHKYVTEDTPLIKDDIKGIAVAFKFNDTVYNGNWEGNTIKCNKDYNKTDLFLGSVDEPDSVLATHNVAGEWQYQSRNDYLYYDFSASPNWSNNMPGVPVQISKARFDLLQGAYDGLTYDLDYVKFVLADDRILPSIPAETEMALDGDYAVTFTYPQGLNVTEDQIAPDAFGKYAINFEFVGENQIKVYVNPAYVWDGNVVPVKSPGFMNADSTKTYVTTYYNMAFETLGAPTTIDAAQIRTDADDTTKQGMRYAAYIETAVEACEYGYIVTLESLIDNGNGTYDYGKLAIDGNVTYNGTAIKGVSAAGIPVVGAVAITGKGAQTIYSTTGEEFLDNSLGDGLYFTTVLTGIPMTKTGVNTRFVGRPYVKLTDGTYVYGAPITRSVFDIANPTIQEALASGGYNDLDKYYQNIYLASLGIPVM